MLRYIKGIVAQVNEDGIILDNHGMGYDIQMPLSSLALLQEGDEVQIRTYMAFGKEDVSLYGFVSVSELEMFQLLLKVSGIGPKGAKNILSALDTETLKMAVLAGDEKLLSSAKGISTKTAQKILVELKGKIPADSVPVPAVHSTSMDGDTRVPEAIAAVAATGFDRTSCVKALSGISIGPEMSVDDIIGIILENIQL